MKTLLWFFIGHAISLTTLLANVDNQPNIILIMTDDQGWWELGAHGNKVIETPALDRLRMRLNKIWLRKL